MMFNSIYLNPELRVKVQDISGTFFPLSYRMQQLFKDWANLSLNRVNFEFIDYLSIPFIDELRTRNLKSNQTESEMIQNYLAGLETVEELAQVIFKLALEDTQPEMLSKINSTPWLNAWGISLDDSKWQADGLFEPKSTPRNLDRIQQQIWEAMGR